MGRRAVAVVVAAASLMGAALAAQRVHDAALASARAEARRRAQVASGAGTEALASLRSDLKAKAAAAAAIQQIASLARDPDRATILDGLEHEDWWKPQRAEFAATGLVFGDAALDAVAGPLQLAPPASLVAEALEAGAASALVNVAGEPVLCGAAHVPGTGAVVVLASRLDAAALKALSARARTPLAVSDGRTLVAASDPAKFAALTGREKERQVEDPAGHWGASAEPVAEGLWLWSLAPSQDAAEQAQRGAAGNQGIAWAVGALLAGAALLAGFRKNREEPEAAQSQLREAARQLDEARRQLERLTPPQPGTQPGAPRNTGESLLATAPRMATPPIALTDEASAGASFGRYHLVERIGAGGMGEVWTAVVFGAEGFKRSFVVKRMRPELSKESALVDQFIDEARLGARLVHSGIVPVFDFGKVGDQYYLAQEYIQGRDLDHLVRSRFAESGQGLPTAVVLHVAHAVLQALSYAHGLADESGAPLGLVHRDVSANNVLVSVRGDVKLLDFGIVKAAGRRNETKAGMVKGNVNCMSPEQARGAAVDARSDLFSLAMTLFRCATGDSLYGDAGTYELLVRAAAGPTEADLARVRAVGGGLAPALEKALAVDPASRFATAAEFAAALPPAPPSAAAETARLVERHFGAVLAEEVARLNSTNPGAEAPLARAAAT